MGLRKTLYDIYWSVERRIVPNLKNCQCVYEEVLQSQVNPEIAWLDLGCGHNILRAWRNEGEKRLVRSCRRVVGIDADLDSLRKHQNISSRVVGDIGRLPFSDGVFNLATANMVVEHLEDPATQFAEVNRVLARGGVFVFHTPNLRGYSTVIARLLPNNVKPGLATLIEGRAGHDVFRTHYKANTVDAIRRLATASGFEVLQVKLIVTTAGLAAVPPLFLPELVWIRLLLTEKLAHLRPNIIAILRKL